MIVDARSSIIRRFFLCDRENECDAERLAAAAARARQELGLPEHDFRSAGRLVEVHQCEFSSVLLWDEILDLCGRGIDWSGRLYFGVEYS